MHTQATSIKIPGELKARINSLADVRKRTPHSMMLEALETYVSHQEKREAWRLEGIAAYEEMQDTGLHLTNGEVTEWLAKLASGQDVEPPKCHI